MMRATAPKPHIPWYKQTKNKFLCERVYFDIDRMGNVFCLDVHESLNKDGDVVKDIIRVQRCCNIRDRSSAASGAMWMLIHENFHRCWPRALESGDIRHCADVPKEQIDSGDYPNIQHMLNRYYNQVKNYLENKNESN